MSLTVFLYKKRIIFFDLIYLPKSIFSSLLFVCLVIIFVYYTTSTKTSDFLGRLVISLESLSFSLKNYESTRKNQRQEKKFQAQFGYRCLKCCCEFKKSTTVSVLRSIS